jgi:hypothetical protein
MVSNVPSNGWLLAFLLLNLDGRPPDGVVILLVFALAFCLGHVGGWMDSLSAVLL